jgi:hypothetical protein
VTFEFGYGLYRMPSWRQPAFISLRPATLPERFEPSDADSQVTSGAACVGASKSAAVRNELRPFTYKLKGYQGWLHFDI